MESRWPNIVIQEGVWSNPVIHRDSVSTPEYCWCIASYCYACCLPIQTYTCETTFNGVKMAEYRHPGRGVVKPGIHRDSLSTPEYCMFLCMLTIHCSPAGVTAITVRFCIASFITALYFMYTHFSFLYNFIYEFVNNFLLLTLITCYASTKQVTKKAE